MEVILCIMGIYQQCTSLTGVFRKTVTCMAREVIRKLERVTICLDFAGLDASGVNYIVLLLYEIET
jgi:hypothetical protein